MSNILFANLPAFGHINPTLPVVSELVQRGHRVIYYNAATFEPVIADTGAAFRPYPESDPFQAELAARIHNLVDVTVLVLTKSRSLVPFLCAEIEREQPDNEMPQAMSAFPRCVIIKASLFGSAGV